MSNDLPEHIAPLRAAVRDFADRELRPRVESMEDAGAIDRDLIDQIGQLGYFGAPFEERWGGSGMGEIGFSIVQEELARAHASTAVMVAASSGLAARMVAVAGSDEQKERFLGPMARGEGVGAFCLTEANAGSDVPAMTTTAVADGDDFILNGQKVFISNGRLAQYFVTFAKTDPAQGGRGISLFVVDAGTPGLEVVRLEDKLGIRASDTAQIAYDNVRVGRDRLIGDENTGLRHALTTLNQSRVGIASISLGMAKEATKLAFAYAHERELFGGTLADQQVSQHALADMQIAVYTAESIVYRTALMADAGENIEAEASICKTYASEAADRVIDRSLQMHGGVGYIRGSAIERLYRDHRVQRIYEGANEVQRNNIYRVMRRMYG
ncbi:MAG: acyl-CoA dehydrogenase family protein [Chloroflexi bacterium]|nr:acyl-CoA dehydrogenase family protein [Chloroflexota bacterium]MDA1147656.1 acyl-CoA dehydrogenase family protein [Chloroflexota bacterium]